jgi:hypothetical protein
MDMKQMKQDLKGLIARGHGSSLKARELRLRLETARRIARKWAREGSELRIAIKAVEALISEAQAKAHPGEKK